MGKKFRHEYKYVINEQISKLCYERLINVCNLDNNVGKLNNYNVRSLYFDDYFDTFYCENENGLENRYKWRIRIYNCSDGCVSLEKKYKVHGMTLKESAKISKELVKELIENQCTFSVNAVNSDLLESFLIECQTRLLKPTVIVDYERIPFVYNDGNVRITIDRNICASGEFDNFFSKDISLRPILETGKHVLEIKYDEYIPSFLKENLNLGKLQRTSFSKYYLCRRIMK